MFVYGVIFSSIFILIALTIISLPCLTKKSKMYYVVSRSLMTLFGLLFLFQLVWFIMGNFFISSLIYKKLDNNLIKGCVWIFRSDTYIDKKSKNQCPDFIYHFSISFLIILTIVNSFFICFIFGVKHSESMSEL